MAQAAGGEDRRHGGGQVLEAGWPVQQCVEYRIGQQVERQGQALGMGSPAAHRRGDRADLGGDQAEAAGVECLAER